MCFLPVTFAAFDGQRKRPLLIACVVLCAASTTGVPPTPWIFHNTYVGAPVFEAMPEFIGSVLVLAVWKSAFVSFHLEISCRGAAA